MREASGLTLAEAARRLGARSRNAYARYEQGSSVPTIEQLNRLIAAVSPGRDFVIRQSLAP
jgi:transcriptional regulator with XRE-family HTH domain